MKKILYLAVAASLSACGSAPDPASEPATASPPPGIAIVGAPVGDAVATVDGETITAPLLDVFARGRGLDPADPAQRQRALDTLVETVLLARDAHARGLTQKPEVQAELALVRLQQLAGRGLSDLRAAVNVDDAQVQAYYDQEAQRTGGIELQLAHLLFADEATASAANERALGGQDFTTLMTEYGAAGAKQARQLDWANLTQLPPELAAATRNLPDGQVAPLPVQTAYGWHVVKRVASRPFTPPPLEQVKEGARKQLQERALAEKVKALRDAATITVPQAPSGASGASGATGS